MEKNHNLYTNSDSFELFLCQQDHEVIGIVNNKEVRKTYASEVDPFIYNELIPVFFCTDLNHKHKLEIRDQQNNPVAPYVFAASELYLCPAFFGRNWSLWKDSKFFLDFF